MKIRYLLIIFVVCLFSGISLGQEKNFTIEISQKNNRLIIGKDNLVKIKITNKSEQILNTQDLTSVTYYLSKCPRTMTELISCSTREDVFVAHSDIDEAKNLRQNKSLEFQVNLADLYWNSLISGNIDFGHPKNLNTIPFTNIHFYAHVTTFNNRAKSKGLSENFSHRKIYESNEIILEFHSK